MTSNCSGFQARVFSVFRRCNIALFPFFAVWPTPPTFTCREVSRDSLFLFGLTTFHISSYLLDVLFERLLFPLPATFDGVG